MKNRNWTFPVVRYFTWKLQFVHDCMYQNVATCTKMYQHVPTLCQHLVKVSLQVMSCHTCLHKFKFYTGLKILFLSKQQKWNCSHSELTLPMFLGVLTGLPGSTRGFEPWAWVLIFHHPVKLHRLKTFSLHSIRHWKVTKTVAQRSSIKRCS